MTQAGVVCELVLTLPEDLNDDGQGALRDQVGYLHEAIVACRLVDGTLHVGLSRSLEEGEQHALAAAYDEIVARTVRSFTKARFSTVTENMGCPTFGDDPLPLLLKTRQAIEAHPGTFTVRGDLLDVMRGLDAFFRKYALSLGAEEQSYPTTVPIASMLRNGYIGNFPHHALMVARVHSDLDAVKRLAQRSGDEEIPLDLLSNAGQMLAPTVCYHCFEALRGHDVAEVGDLFTAVSSCHRWEGVATGGLARLQTFTMRELVFFGSAGHVSDMKSAIMNHACDTFVGWGVGFHLTTATDPFFAVNAEAKRTFQTLQALKHELRITLPFDRSTLACASFNNHKDTLVRSYEVTDSRSNRVFSGCVGYGFERMAYGLFAHFGLDLSTWPATVREDLNLGR